MFSQTSEDTGTAKYETGLLFDDTIQRLQDLFLKFYVFDHVKITKCASPLVNDCRQPATRQYAGCSQN
jgi:hypothetical protein